MTLQNTCQRVKIQRMKNSKSPLVYFIVTVGMIAILALFGPEEKSLGSNVRIVYLHGAWVLTAEIAFFAAALTGLLGLLLRRDLFHTWSAAPAAPWPARGRERGGFRGRCGRGKSAGRRSRLAVMTEDARWWDRLKAVCTSVAQLLQMWPAVAAKLLAPSSPSGRLSRSAQRRWNKR